MVSSTWNGFEKPVVMKSYYHSLSTITNALSDNGFIIEKILEPIPTEEFAKADIAEYKKLLRFPLFIVIRAIKKQKGET